MLKKLFLITLVLSLAVAFIGCDLINGEDDNSSKEEDTLVPTSTITVNSEPSGANVYLDDSLTGQITPCVLERCQYGSSYNLKLTYPDYLDWEKPIHLEGGQDHPVVDVYLIKPDGSNIKVEASATLTSNGYGCKYVYKFNVDFLLTLFAFKWPDHNTYNAYKTFGFCQENTWNTTVEFGSTSGDRVPVGTHNLLFCGTDDVTEQQCIFEVDITATPGASQSVKVRKLRSIPESWSSATGDGGSASVVIRSQ
jgi:hypothetical protein